MNKATLYGIVGNDPKVRTTESGKKIATISLATTKHRKNKDNQKVSETTWHNIVLWEHLAELAEKYVKKGSSLIIEGEISYRTYEDKNGVTKYITEIVAREMHFVGSKKEGTNKTQLDLAKETAEFKNDIDEEPPFA